jgi:hypothetical protein
MCDGDGLVDPRPLLADKIAVLYWIPLERMYTSSALTAILLDIFDTLAL